MGNTKSTEAQSLLDKSQEELESTYSLEKISVELKALLPEDISFDGVKTWDEFERMRGIFRFFQSYKVRLREEYFLSDEAKAIYELTEFDGEHRLKKLGITPAHYKTIKTAKAWRSKYTFIHPDRCAHVNATQASAVVNELYEGMVKHGR